MRADLHSTVVLLKLSLSLLLLSQHSHLHSTVVLLKLWLYFFAQNHWKNLHSTVVLLKHTYLCWKYDRYNHLHSTVVLLKPLLQGNKSSGHNKFTFYCSSIKTRSPPGLGRGEPDLHSTVVLLKRVHYKLLQLLGFSFQYCRLSKLYWEFSIKQ